MSDIAFRKPYMLICISGLPIPVLCALCMYSDVIVAYKTRNGKTKFSLILEADETVQITRLKVRAENGSRGAKCGVVFLFPLSEVITTKRFVAQCVIMFMSAELVMMISMFMFIELVIMMLSLGSGCHCVLSLLIIW